IRRRLQSRDVSVLYRGRVFPDREARQLTDVAADGKTAVRSGVVEQGQCPASSVAMQVIEIDVLAKARRWSGICVVRGDALGGACRLRRHLTDGRHDPAARFEKRRADIAVIQKLHLGWLRPAVFDDIMDDYAI